MTELPGLLLCVLCHATTTHARHRQQHTHQHKVCVAPGADAQEEQTCCWHCWALGCGRVRCCATAQSRLQGMIVEGGEENVCDRQEQQQHMGAVSNVCRHRQCSRRQPL